MAGLTNKRLSLIADILKNAQKGKNTVFSPLCLEDCLRLLEKGSDGVTKEQLLKLLDEDEGERFENIKDVFSKAMALVIKPSLKDQIKKEFIEQTGITCLEDEFCSTQTVNKWIEKNTFGMVKDARPKMPHKADLILCTTLAIQMAWADDYFADDELGYEFFPKYGHSVYAEGMNIIDDYDQIWVKEGQDVTVISMDLKSYGNVQLESVLLMPKDMDTYLETFEKRYENDLSNLTPVSQYKYGVELIIPKFKVTSDIDLKEVLIKAGISDIFDPKQSDLSKMIRDGGSLTNIFQSCYYDFSKEGVKAAAATSGYIKCFGMPKEKRKIIFDHPCIFAVRDKRSGSIFFIGTLYQPQIRNRELDEYEELIEYDEETGDSTFTLIPKKIKPKVEHYKDNPEDNEDEGLIEDEGFEEFKWCVLILLDKELKKKTKDIIADYRSKIEKVLSDRYIEECNLYGCADPKACAQWLLDIFPELPMRYIK